MQALRVGGLAIVAIPCEVFVEIGLKIKAESLIKPAFTIELANGYNGYLPPRSSTNSAATKPGGPDRATSKSTPPRKLPPRRSTSCKNWIRPAEREPLALPCTAPISAGDRMCLWIISRGLRRRVSKPRHAALRSRRCRVPWGLIPKSKQITKSGLDKGFAPFKN